MVQAVLLSADYRLLLSDEGMVHGYDKLGDVVEPNAPPGVAAVTPAAGVPVVATPAHAVTAIASIC